MEEYIEIYEKSAGNNITEEMVKFLYKNINKEELKETYKKVLKKLKKYNNNYYSKICIIINALKFKKEQNKTLKFPYDIYYINLPLRGSLQTEISGRKHQIKTVEKLIEYEDINPLFEAIGEEKTKKQRKRLILTAKELLEKPVLDLNQGIEWKENYKNYIIKTYGRWSKEYNDYMTTLFDIGFLPISPNLLMTINRDHIRKAIEEKVELLEKEYNN